MTNKQKYALENDERGAVVKDMLNKSKRYDALAVGLETAVSDLLGDIRHLCDNEGLEFAKLDRRGHGHYTAEVVQAKTGLIE